MTYLVATARPILEDLIATIAFYLLYLATGSAAFAAMVGLSIGVGQIGFHLLRGRTVPALLLIGVTLTAALGGITVFTHDARFILLKPSIIYGCIGASMLRRGWVLRYVPAIARQLLPAATFDRVGLGWAALMFGTAAINLALVAALPARRAAIAFTLWAAASKVALFAAQYVTLRSRARRAYAQRSEPR